MKRFGFVSVSLIGLLLVLPAHYGLLAQSGTTKTPPEFDRENIKRRTLSFRSRFVMNRALVNNLTKLPVLVAARPRQSEAAAKRIAGLGGRVDFRADEIDYIRGIIPTEKVQELFASEAVLDVQIGFASIATYDWDRIGPQPLPSKNQPKPPQDTLAETGTPSPLLTAKEMTAENPYLPTRDIGAPQFIQAHPTFDGRGTTIAVIEGVADPTHPTLQTARAIDGTVIPKSIAILDPSDPDHDELIECGFSHNPDLTTIDMTEVIQVKGATFEHDNLEYIAPRPGTYRFGKFKHVEIGNGQRKNIDIAVLWDPTSNILWVDTNNNRSFADERPVRDFNRSHDIGHFPLFVVSKDKEGVNRFISFLAITDPGKRFVHIYESSIASHVTSAASLAAGSAFLGGDASGSAPGARVLYVPIGDARLERFLEGVFAAALRNDVDVISASVGLIMIPDDGESFASLILDRIVAQFQKPILMSAGNDWTVTAENVLDGSSASRVLAIGGYNSQATREVFAPRLTGSASEDFVSATSSKGPTGIGRLKPDLLAPNWTVAAAPCALDSPPLYTTVVVPPCYTIHTGTSEAAPIAAGAIALLVSAAKQSGVPYDAASISWALRVSARRFSGFPVNREGAGLIQISEAWKLLQQRKAPLPDISFAAAVRSEYPQYLKTPDTGVGFYERGWLPGTDGERVLRAYRKNGPSTSMRYKITLPGNDGTFSAPHEVDLPLQHAVEIPIKIQVPAAGVHDAILRLTDGKTGLPVADTVLTIVAADELRLQNHYRSELSATLKTGEWRSLYVNVPADVAALKIGIKLDHGDVTLASDCPLPFARTGGGVPCVSGWMWRGAYSAPLSKVHVYSQPEAGVWEFRVYNGDPTWMSPVSDGSNPGGLQAHFHELAQFSLQVEGLGVNPAATATAKTMRPVGDTSVASLQVANDLVNAGNSTVNINRGRMLQVPVSATASSVQVSALTVTQGTESLFVRLQTNAGEISDGQGAVDLYLYNCDSPAKGAKPNHCYLWDMKSSVNGTPQILVRWPNPGRWKILVDNLNSSRIEGLTLSEVVVPASRSAMDTAGATSDHWQLVDLIETFDAACEREEELSPFMDFTRYARSDFRPVPLSLTIVPVTPASAQKSPHIASPRTNPQ